MCSNGYNFLGGIGGGHSSASIIVPVSSRCGREGISMHVSDSILMGNVPLINE